ncbi:MAG: FAD-dependent oxidoreductase, partial [Exilibacterium sp.]
MKLSSYWLDTAPTFGGASQEPVEGKADVVVVGAGLTGVSAALALAKKGARVVVCEAETVGHAASGRNGGMCNNGFAQDYAAIAAKFGTEKANYLYHSFDKGVDTIERLVREEGIDCSFKRVGKLKLAAKPEHYEKLVRTQALLVKQADPDTEIVTREQLRDELGSQRYYGGMLFKKSAGMHVGRFVTGLAEAAARRGVQIHERTPVTGFRQVQGGHEVTTPRGRIVASQVLLASGISQVGPLGWIRRRVVPVGAFIIVTEPLPTDLLDQLIPRRRMYTDTKNLVNYFRTTPDNRF